MASGGRPGVELPRRRQQMAQQHDLAHVVPSRCAARAQDLIERADGLPAQPGQKLDSGLFDQRVLRILGF